MTEAVMTPVLEKVDSKDLTPMLAKRDPWHA